MVNPSVVDGRRGGWGRHCPLFHVLCCGVSKSFAAQEKRGSLWNRVNYYMACDAVLKHFWCPRSISETFLGAHRAFPKHFWMPTEHFSWLDIIS